jgi:hypothetical protein
MLPQIASQTDVRGYIEVVSENMFREPEGLMRGLVYFGFSAVCVLAWIFIGAIVGGSAEWPSPFLLILALTWGLLGTAESLPLSRRRTIGTLRIITVSIPIAMLTHLALVPEFYLS